MEPEVRCVYHESQAKERESTVSDEKPPVEPRQQSIELPTIESRAEVFEPAGISMRPYFSDYHIRAAAHFARESAEMERENAGRPWGEINETVFYEHRACVMGAVLSSAAFLEAAINELFVDAVKHEAEDPEPAPTDPPRPVDQLPRGGRKLMAEMWPFDVDRLKILGKYDAALILNGKPKMDASTRPHQDVDALVALRNNLVHYEPRDIAAGLALNEETERMARKLGDRGFAPNPFFAESGNPYYPDKALGHGCARWAVERSIEFADAFFASLGVIPRYEEAKPFDTGSTGT